MSAGAPSTAAIAACELGASPRVFCTATETEGVHLGTAVGFPRTEAHSSDASAPVIGDVNPLATTALRALFMAGGPLVAGSQDLTTSDETALRDAFHQDVSDGAASMASLGLRWRVDAARPFCVRKARGDVYKTDCTTFLCEVEEAKPRPQPDPPWEGEVAGRWTSVADLEREWSKGRSLLSPALGLFMKSGVGVGAETWRTWSASTPDPTEVLGWWVTPVVQMLPVRTPTLPPATHTNTFMIGEDEVVLVEPASPYNDELDVVVQWVKGAARGRTVKAILATHHHPDHIGGAVALRDRLDAPLWAHPLTAQRLDGAVAFDRLIGDGDTVELNGGPTLRAVHTPGHAPGHLCFADSDSGALVAGDMVAGVGTIIVEPHDGDMTLYLESLRRMSRLEPTMLLPAHGGVIREPQQWLDYYESHRLMREQKIFDALSAFAAPALPNDIVANAYDDAPKAVWPLALRSIEAHLIKLERDGRVARQANRWALV